MNIIKKIINFFNPNPRVTRRKEVHKYYKNKTRNLFTGWGYCISKRYEKKHYKNFWNRITEIVEGTTYEVCSLNTINVRYVLNHWQINLYHFKDGEIHNEYGPAEIDKLGLFYYLNNKEYSLEEYLKELHRRFPERNIFFNIDEYLSNDYKYWINQIGAE